MLPMKNLRNGQFKTLLNSGSKRSSFFPSKALDHISLTAAGYINYKFWCPESLAITETCQTAFMNFRVMIESENPQEISEFYTTKTQEFIAKGKLQEELERVDPLNALKIVNASLPVRYTFPQRQLPVVKQMHLHLQRLQHLQTAKRRKVCCRVDF